MPKIGEVVKQRDGTADLAALAQTINSREKRSKEDAVQHAIEQGRDLIKAQERLAVVAPKTWRKWVKENLTISIQRVDQYKRFAASSLVTSDPPATLEELWSEWQRIQGNVKPEPEEDEEEDDNDNGPDDNGTDDDNDDGGEGDGNDDDPHDRDAKECFEVELTVGTVPVFKEIGLLAASELGGKNEHEGLWLLATRWRDRELPPREAKPSLHGAEEDHV